MTAVRGEDGFAGEDENEDSGFDDANRDQADPYKARGSKGSFNGTL